MNEFVKIGIYGDSIMRATVPDENLRYHFRIKEFMGYFKELPIKIINRAKFGATVSKGESILLQDAQAGLDYDLALIEYGGNDCDYDWAAIAEAPDNQHSPHTDLSRFVQTINRMIDLLLTQSVQPVLMTLPPIDSQKYFDYIVSKGLNSENLINWMGDVNYIYHFQELYSDAVAKIAAQRQLVCVDVRSAFLADRRFNTLISQDGIHPTKSGYKVMFSELLRSVRGYTKKLEIASA